MILDFISSFFNKKFQPPSPRGWGWLTAVAFIFLFAGSANADRRWSSGFELQSTTAGIEVDGYSGSGQSIDTTTKRSGAASMRINVSGAAATSDALIGLPVSVDRLFMRIYLYIATAPSAATGVLESDNGGVVTYCGITLNTNRTLQLYYNKNVASVATKTNIGSATAALNTGQWYRLELFSNSNSGGGCAARLDGSIFAVQLGITDFLGSMGTDLVQMRWGIDAGVWGAPYLATGDLYFDDAAMNDAVGASQDAWPGPGKIVYLRPNADGDNHGWTHDTGGAGDANNYTEVSETTPDDATSYVKRISAGTITDDYNVTSSSTAGIASTDAVKLIQVGARIGATSNTAATRDATLRIKSASGGTTTSSAVIDWSINGWATNSDPTFDMYDLTSFTDPTTGIAWAPTGTNSLDNMQIGFQNATSSTNEIRVSTIWGLVEYNPTSTAPSVWYRFDENTGNFVNDATGKGDGGTLGDSSCSAGSGTCPSWVTGRHGSALSFDGTDDYVDAEDNDDLDGLQAVTVSAWIKSASVGGAAAEKHVVDKSSCDGVANADNFELGVGVFTPDKASFIVFRNNGVANVLGDSFFDSGASTTSVDDTKWHLLIGVYDGTFLRIYVDGVQENSTNIGSITMPLTAKALEIGGNCNGQGVGNSYLWNGLIDDVRVYTRALSAGEVRKIYNASNAINWGTE